MSDDGVRFDDHDLGAGFDPSVCTGEHPDVEGECPHLNADASGFRGAVQAAADALGAATCGTCGCPITNMELLDAPPKPAKCPRYQEHTE